jgi:hypothetical protein
MQDVNRGEVAPWVVCGHREGHSKAWPAVRMQGRGLIATFLLRFPRLMSRLIQSAPQYLLACHSLPLNTRWFAADTWLAAVACTPSLGKSLYYPDRFLILMLLVHSGHPWASCCTWIQLSVALYTPRDICLSVFVPVCGACSALEYHGLPEIPPSSLVIKTLLGSAI